LIQVFVLALLVMTGHQHVATFLLTAIFGMMPLGSVLVGYVSEQIAAPNTLLIEGAVGLLIALIFRRVLLERVFLRRATVLSSDQLF